MALCELCVQQTVAAETERLTASLNRLRPARSASRPQRLKPLPKADCLSQR